MTEKNTAEKVVVKWLDSDPQAWGFKEHGDRYGKKGVPDFIVSYHGQFVGIETKAGNGYHLKGIQLYEGLNILNTGGQYVVAYPDFTGLNDVTPFDVRAYGIDLQAISASTKPRDLDVDQLTVLANMAEHISKMGKSIILV